MSGTSLDGVDGDLDPVGRAGAAHHAGAEATVLEGELEHGIVKVADLLERQPWDGEIPTYDVVTRSSTAAGGG